MHGSFRFRGKERTGTERGAVGSGPLVAPSALQRGARGRPMHRTGPRITKSARVPVIFIQLLTHCACLWASALRYWGLVGCSKWRRWPVTRPTAQPLPRAPEARVGACGARRRGTRGVLCCFGVVKNRDGPDLGREAARGAVNGRAAGGGALARLTAAAAWRRAAAEAARGVGGRPPRAGALEVGVM